MMKRLLATLLLLIALPLSRRNAAAELGALPGGGHAGNDGGRVRARRYARRLRPAGDVARGREAHRGVPASPQQVTWSGGRSILVVTGDMIDKWNQSLEVIALMRALISSAASQGGRVVISTGNHEAEFLEDPHEQQDEGVSEGAEGRRTSSRAEVADGTDSEGIGRFLLCLPFASRVNGWFFSHAGSTKGRTLESSAPICRRESTRRATTRRCCSATKGCSRRA